MHRMKTALGFTTLLNWATWSFTALLVSSQFLCIVWDSTTDTRDVFYGRSPLDNGLSAISGTNDEPYSDRSIVCMARGRSFEPMQLSRALRDPQLSTVTDVSGASINGYRVIQRKDEIATLDSTTQAHYSNLCSVIDKTLESIQDSCETLGYNITRDVLRIVPDITSNSTKAIPKALPVLAMPFWDNAPGAHYVIPGWDGMACSFRLDILPTKDNDGVMRGVVRDVRAAKTVEWLNKPGGEWRNGWYEDGSGQRWSSAMDSTKEPNPLGLETRTFNTGANTRSNCSAAAVRPVECDALPFPYKWGTGAVSTGALLDVQQAFISNGTHFGQFFFRATMTRTVQNKYTLETFVSNVSTSLLCVRWFVSMLAMLNSYRHGLSGWNTTGLGCLSSSRAFAVLPILLLPRLKLIMAVFWTIGCDSDGDRVALADAWFAMYPAIVELVLLLYSVLNAITKVTQRRMSDVLVGPTLLALALLHYYRVSLAKLPWIGSGGRVPTLVTSAEFELMRVFDLFLPSVALRMNGNVQALVLIKVAVVVLNFVPLLLSRSMTRSNRLYRSFTPCRIEATLALRASNIGGLGLSQVYSIVHEATAKKKINRDTSGPAGSAINDMKNSAPATASEQTPVEPFNRSKQVAAIVPTAPAATSSHVLVGYEINRLGYIVFGDRFLITFEDWYVLTTLAPLRVIEKLWNHRITVFDVTKRAGGYDVNRMSRLCRLDDEELRRVRWYNVTVVSFR